MTARAVVIGIIGAILVGAGGRYCANHVPGAHGIVTGHMPVSVFSLLIFFAMVVNPLLGKVRPSWRLRAKEMALILVLFLAACSIPTAGLMRYFPRTLVQPLAINRTHPGWQKLGLLKMTPELLANNGEYSNEVVRDYIAPMGEPGRPIPITAVPWRAWWKPLAIWGGIIVCTFLGVLSLSLLLHRQWAVRERLPYPIATLATALLKQDENGRTLIFQHRPFWYAMAAMMAIRLLNGFKVWFPDLIAIPLTLDFSALRDGFPLFMQTPGASAFLNPHIYPACIGFTFLLASDIAFSLSMSHVLTVVTVYAMMVLGVEMSGSAMSGGATSWLVFGAFLAQAVMLFYCGRRYYLDTLVQSLSFRPRPDAERSDLWACRMFLLCMAGATGILAAVGLDWPVAMLAVGLVMLLYVVCARMIAECGTFFFAPGWMMPGVLAGLFGAQILGPKIIIILGLLFYILCFDPFECLMPYLMNGLKIAADTALKPGRTCLIVAIGLLLAIAVAVPTALWSDYNLQADMRHGGDTAEVYNAAELTANQMALTGQAETVSQFTPWERVTHMQPSRTFLLFAGLGLALVLACSFLRLRYTWWPLHPVIFLGFGSWTMGQFGFSFFLGWLAKSAICRFGGADTYLKVRPAIIGIVIGDLAGGGVLLLAGWLYYAITGTAGVSALLW
jgi:hypothetical protein